MHDYQLYVSDYAERHWGLDEGLARRDQGQKLASLRRIMIEGRVQGFEDNYDKLHRQVVQHNEETGN